MGTLYLVRHAQASLGAADYDHLSALGREQSLELGRYLAAKGLHFEAAVTGSLKRHCQTLQYIGEGMGLDLQASQDPGLNEYDSRAVIAAVSAQQPGRVDSAEQYRQHFRQLRIGLTQWMLGQTLPEGMPSWAEFQRGVMNVLTHIRQSHSANVLLVSSGGPIACAIGHILQTPAEATVELNMRLRNSAVSEFSFTPTRFALQTYNTLPHLDAPDRTSWITYA